MTVPGLDVAANFTCAVDAWVERWPPAAVPLGRAQYKTRAADFKVVERPLPAAQVQRLDAVAGAPQRLFNIRKTGINTTYVVQLLARWASIAPVEVGYAGRKDRHAITQQWFSVPDHAVRKALDSNGAFASYAAPLLQDAETLEVVAQAGQQRKLRVGELAGNDFEVTLRDLSFEQDSAPGAALESALQALTQRGVPNYFGAQRFGRDNLDQALAWLAGQADPSRRRKAGRRRKARGSGAGSALDGGWQRSILRSYLFNQVLAARVVDGTFAESIAGDVLAVDGRAATAPLWGRGRSSADAQALAVEESALAPYAALCSALEHTGLNQQRRALCVWPENLSWRLDGDQLQLRFGLPSGAYASVLLEELFTLTDAAVLSTDEAARSAPGFGPKA
ncbi:MAG: tRNA pseudouridine(13) synthase TruD [Pseudomonadales bacterium]